MSVLESEPAARIQWRPLGELLVETGVITRAELDAALAEQAKTGKLLGEILVALGAVSGPALTVALAEQWGVDVAPESGFGTGLWREIERRHRLRRKLEGAESVPRPRLTVVSSPEAPEEPTAGDEPETSVAALQEQKALLEVALQAAEDRLREYEQRIPELEIALTKQEREAPSQPELAHVRFFQDSDRYALVEADGAPPPVGADVELDGGVRYTVWKVGRSPLPADARLCAFLEPSRLR